MKRKYIIDTDIGDDIDDAFAISLAAGLPEAELVGVTTVFRNTAARAQQAKKLLVSANASDVPVVAGERLPIKEPVHPFEKDDGTPPENSLPCQWEELYGAYSVEEGAVDFLIAQAERYGGELTIVAIGPLTNLAKAIEKSPASMRKIEKIVCMGGSFQKTMPEWNVLCDPEAADVVYRSGIPFFAVGLDVTMQCPMERDLLEKFRSSKKEVNGLLSLWLDRWFAFFGFEKSVMHDPLAVACCFRELCTFRQIYVKADLSQTRGAVLTSETPRKGYSPVYAAYGVNREAFYALVESTLL